MLRPVFTQQLADHLLAGQSVNLVSPHGRGRRQTLEDLMPLLSDVKVQKIDLKREQDMWNSWLKETLALSGQPIVIIHNIEHLGKDREAAFASLKVFALLCVSELPMGDEGMFEIEIPE